MGNMNKIELYDTTLRDGAQSEGISFSVSDKLKICEKLDELGIHFIEGGWPGANPKDLSFFKAARSLKLKNAKLVAFGSTRRAKSKAKSDKVLNALVGADTGIITIFGKSWDLHVRDVLKADLDENLTDVCKSLFTCHDGCSSGIVSPQPSPAGGRGGGISVMSSRSTSGTPSPVTAEKANNAIPFSAKVSMSFSILSRVAGRSSLPIATTCLFFSMAGLKSSNSRLIIS